MCSLRFENNLLIIKGVRFASISKKTPLSKLSFAFVSLALPLLVCYGGVGVGDSGQPCQACSTIFSHLVVGSRDYEEDWMSSSLLGCAGHSTKLQFP